MKKIIRSFAVALTASYVCAQSSKPIWNATVKVLDEAGLPVASTHVEMSWYVNAPDGTTTFDKMEGLTDTNGSFKTSHEANGSIGLGFTANKAGYYSTTKGYELAQLQDSNPAKWNPNVTLVLKKMGKQIPMYAKQITSITFPEFNKAFGYDLEVGDWVGPHGKGVNTDILFTENHPDKTSSYTFTISFPKPSDGIQEFIAPVLVQNATTGQSDLKSSQDAPTNGYQPAFVQIDFNQNRNFYFRVRTKLDENGNVVSAHYGKIYGELPQFTYYLNPTMNDRNLEFDPKQNLLGGLQSFEQVRQP